jgi:glutathione S-transferase
MELYLELPARRLYGAAYFGGSASDELKREVEAQLSKGLRALSRVTRIKPFIMGERFGAGDCAAAVHLPLMSATCKVIFGRDPLEAHPELQAYLAQAQSRPSVQRVNADRKAALAAFIEYRARLAAARNEAPRSA